MLAILLKNGSFLDYRLQLELDRISDWIPILKMNLIISWKVDMLQAFQLDQAYSKSAQ